MVPSSPGSPQDASKISLTEDWKVRYWSKKFGCTDVQCRAAVKAVGHGADAVTRRLGK